MWSSPCWFEDHVGAIERRPNGRQKAAKAFPSPARTVCTGALRWAAMAAAAGVIVTHWGATRLCRARRSSLSVEMVVRVEREVLERWSRRRRLVLLQPQQKPQPPPRAASLWGQRPCRLHDQAVVPWCGLPRDSLDETDWSCVGAATRPPWHGRSALGDEAPRKEASRCVEALHRHPQAEAARGQSGRPSAAIRGAC
eukprot:scaffold133146_cov28-Tisochrysis_lutea.AAC.2